MDFEIDQIEKEKSRFEAAIQKLASYVYFDKQNLVLREQFASFINEYGAEANKNYAQSLATKVLKRKFKIKKEDIELFFLPKNVNKGSEKLSGGECFEPNFYTNQFYLEKAKVGRFSTFVKASIDIHLISIVWILKYGIYLDAELSEDCMGNRLLLDSDGKVARGRSLFQRYEKKYQNWWSKGIKATKELLEKKENVTIINVDFKDFYHSIVFDFDQLTKKLSKIEKIRKEIKEDPIHEYFIKIHQKYFKQLRAYNINGVSDKCGGNKTPLPIGMLSSYVLGNWYLKEFDENVAKKLRPTYYGRYVDDIMIVLKDTLIEKYDCPEQKKTKDPSITKFYLDEYFKGIFEKDKENDYHVANTNKKEYKNVKIQKDKLFIYQFNAKLSPNLLHRFEEEQRERVSAFQFLSEDDDDTFKNLDEITFESNFDTTNDSKAKFKNLDDNKFKLAVYLSKLIRGTLISGSDYYDEEAKKIKKFFKGYYLIKNYYFWEKLFAFWIIKGESETVVKLVEEIERQIEELQPNKDEKDIDYEVMLPKLKDSLHHHLINALAMAHAIHPDLKNEKGNKNYQNLIKRLLGSEELELRYRKSGLIRKSYVYFPLLQFTDIARKEQFSLCSRQNIEQILLSGKGIIDPKTTFFPYRIKLYEAILFKTYERLSAFNKYYKTKHKYKNKDYLDTQAILNKGFNFFYQVNNLGQYDSEENIKKEYFQQIDTKKSQVYPLKHKGLKEAVFKVPNSGELKNGKFRVSMINKYVDFKDYEKSLEGTPNINATRFDEFNQIWDDVKKVPNCDLFIMPELALPHSFLSFYTMKTVYEQIGFVSGIEHMKVGNLGFNFIFTCLPLEVYGDRDAIPILRVKNHYAPAEEVWIEGKRMIVPKPDPYRYNLIQWRNLYFSDYYCFELADIKHRHLFYGLMDVVFAPVWNPDMNYYNSLVETASRDMHTTFVLTNTTQYGDSRATIPAKRDHMDKARVKGGTVHDYKATLLVVDLKIKQIRYFQTHAYVSVDDFNKKHSSHYKPLPPDYPHDYAERRYKNKLFDEVEKEEE